MLRGKIFLVSFYAITAALMIVYLPTLLLPRRFAVAGLELHSRLITWLFSKIMGVPLSIIGSDNLPNGPFLLASQHQSAWETVALIHMLHDPALVMKEELLRIPLYGTFAKKFGMIPINRTAGVQALRVMLKEARNAVDDGRTIIIFPEGTRQPHGAPFQLQSGVSYLYRALDIPCVPVALNSGLYWPSGATPVSPGPEAPPLQIVFGRPIEPGLERDVFENRLSHAIQSAFNATRH